MILTDIQERWLQALESGEYKQGKTYLCSIGDYGDKSYCCLGVACHLLGVPEQKRNNRIGYTNAYIYLKQCIYRLGYLRC